MNRIGLQAIGFSIIAFLVMSVVQSSEEGPTIEAVMPQHADLVPTTEPVNLTLKLVANVTDLDGVSTVIGSYSNRSEGIWTNVSMHLVDLYYEAIAKNFTLGPLHMGYDTGVIWDIKIYANDTLGNWNSVDTFLSIVGWFSTTSNESFSIPEWMTVMIVGMGIVIVVCTAIAISYAHIIRKKPGA